MMQVWLFGTAAAINALAMLVHVVLGGRTFVRPLLASDLAPETTWMAYFMWHVATVSVAATAILFALAAASDFLDGYIARKRGEISALGAALDPIADKLLTTAVALLLIADGTVSGLHILVVMVIVLREIWISGLREALAGTIALPVTRLAKWKTTVQFLAFGLLIMPPVNASRDGAVFFLWAAAALTVWTGARYTRAALRRLRDSGSPR